MRSLIVLVLLLIGMISATQAQDRTLKCTDKGWSKAITINQDIDSAETYRVDVWLNSSSALHSVYATVTLDTIASGNSLQVQRGYKLLDGDAVTWIDTVTYTSTADTTISYTSWATTNIMSTSVSTQATIAGESGTIIYDGLTVADSDTAVLPAISYTLPALTLTNTETRLVDMRYVVFQFVGAAGSDGVNVDAIEVKRFER